MLRVLIVGQSYIGNESRKKLACLAQSPEVSVSLVVPSIWEHDSFGRYEYQPDPIDAGFSVYPIPIRQNGRVFAFSYALSPLLQVIRKTQPDILQVEQEPGSVALFEVGILAKLGRRSKLVGFAWENLDYKQLALRHYLEKIELPWLDYLMVGSTASGEVFRQKGYRGPIAVLPNVGVDPQHFAPQAVPKLKQALELEGHFVIGFVGRLVKEKGCDDLIRALAQLPDDSCLLLVGDGSMRAELAELGRQLRVSDRIIFQGAVPHSQVAQYLNCMDCLVLPSHTLPRRWREQFGLVLVQAMSCSIPVVGSNSGAIPEVIGNAGLIFAEGDTNTLRDCLVRLHSDLQFRADVGTKGRARVMERYTNQRIAEKTLAIYRELMGKHESLTR